MPPRRPRTPEVSLARDLPTMAVPRATIDVDAEKHDDDPLSSPIRALRVGAGGDVTVRYTDDAVDRTFTLADGEYLQGIITHVRDTGTDATGVIGFI